MFYCDACAKEKRYPVAADDRLRSFGKCELCGETTSCNNFKGDLLELGDVTVYVSSSEKVLNTTDSCFKAEKGSYRVIGFDTDHIWGDETTSFVPVFFTEDFPEKKKAIEELLLKREANKKESVLYFVFDDTGNMAKIG